MDEENEEYGKPDEITLDGIGKGLAFLGVVLFVAFAFLFTLSISMPQMFNLFSGWTHFFQITIISLGLIIGGYLLCRSYESSQKEDAEI